MARLKVFTAPMGFFDTVVAAPSQKAALEAWGARQNLFQEGLASITQEREAVAAALARPGVVLKRAQGSKGAFEEAAAPPSAPSARRPAKGGKAGKGAEAAPRPRADRSELDRAEAELDRLDAGHRKVLSALQREAAEIRSRIEDLEARHRRDRARAERTVEKARSAYRRAGGKD